MPTGMISRMPQKPGRPRRASRIIAGLACAVWILNTVPASRTSATEFRSALPGYQFRFPQDHGTHNDFQTEWWYYTGHLRTDEGKTFGFQLTFFRRAAAHEAPARNPSRWAIRHLYFAHFAVTDEGGRRFHFAEKISRAGIGKAGAQAGRLGVWIDDWGVQSDGTVHNLRAQADGIALRLRLTPEKPPAIHGADGISRKGEGPGESSHYYSFTRMRTDGTLTVGGTSRPVTGLSWMDHEFGSNQLGSEQVGWDWFSLQFSDSTELMVYQIRRRDGSVEPASGGTWIKADGTSVSLPRNAIVIDVLDHWQSPQSGSRYPDRWRIRVPSLRLAAEVTPTVSNQELVTRRSTHITYWEGSVLIAGEREGRPVSGLGYAELTGYSAPLRQRL